LEPSVDRMLLHGVGCAGGLAIMRAAAQIAAGATAFGRPARILAFACELCTPNGRCELTEAEKTTAENVGIAGALFSDASAAFILCNDLGLGTAKPLFELLEWGTTTIPETAGKMSFFVKPDGKLSASACMGELKCPRVSHHHIARRAWLDQRRHQTDVR
jgi:type III polyketide synthase